MTRCRALSAVASALALVLFIVPTLAAVFASDTPSTPGEVPRDATGRCHDGTWSSAAKKKGACSQHGGVSAWFGKPPRGAMTRCKDGSYSKSAGQGACSSHGGVAYEIKPPAKQS